MRKRKPLAGLARAELDLCIGGLMLLLKYKEPNENDVASLIFGTSLTVKPAKREDIAQKERVIFLIAKLISLRDGLDIDALIRETIKEPSRESRTADSR